MEGEKEAGGGTLLRFHIQQIFAVEGGGAAGDLVAGAAGQDVGQGRLARAVGAHDGVDFTRGDREVDAVQDDFPVLERGRELLDLQH